MEIRRDFYLDKLIKRKNNGLIKVITGIRRCGKSYLLNNLFYHHLLESGVDADHIIRFAFDSADDLYLIGESLIQIEKEKRGVDPEKFMAYIRSKVTVEKLRIRTVASLNEKMNGLVVAPKLNIVMTTYYKETELEEVLKTLADYLDSASSSESDISCL